MRLLELYFRETPGQQAKELKESLLTESQTPGENAQGLPLTFGGCCHRILPPQISCDYLGTLALVCTDPPWEACSREFLLSYALPGLSSSIFFPVSQLFSQVLRWEW